ncbi:MAG: hypothetical protein K9M02_10325 [Thiohalocapsa sp.]|nr:hypothetical protein [Thiohalocapsa sp.]
MVYIVGMHRSGTSAATACLGALGVELGDRLMPGLEDNPKGFFEDLDLAGVNLRLFSALSAHWDTLLLPGLDTLQPGAFDAALAHAVDILTTRFADGRPAAFKDPRTTRLAPFWLSVAAHCGRPAHFLAVLRHPLAVADSLRSRDRMPRRKALMLWLFYQADAARLLLDHGGFLVLYDELLDDPCTVLESLAAFVGATPDNAALRRFAVEFLSAKLRHHAYAPDADDLDSDTLECLCRDLFLALRARGRGETAPESARSALRRVLARVDDFKQAQRPWLACLDELTGLHHARVESIEAELRRVHGEARKAQEALQRKEQELALAHEELARTRALMAAPPGSFPAHAERRAAASTASDSAPAELSQPAPQLADEATSLARNQAPGDASREVQADGAMRGLSQATPRAPVTAARRTLDFIVSGFRKRFH